MDMHILILFLFLISFGRGQKLLDHEDFDSLEQPGVEASNFGRKTSSGGDVVLRISDDDDDDDDDTAPRIEKNQSFSSFFFNPGKNEMIHLTENNHNKESTSEESSRSSIRPFISGRSHSAELQNSQTSNEVPFEVTEVSVLTQVSQADDSIELLTSELLKDSGISLTTSNEVSREANAEFRTNQSPEDQNSFEPPEFIIKTVANGRVFATLLNNSDESTSAQASDEVSTEVNLRLLDSITEEVTEASKPRGFFVRPEKNGRNFVTQLNNRRLDSNEDSFEVKVQTTQDAVKQSTFFVRPIIGARNFAAELTSDKNNNLFHDSVEDSLEVTVLRSDPVKKAQETPVQPEFFVKPVINGRQFSLEKKINNLFHDSVEDSLEVTALRSNPVNKVQETAVQPEFFIKPVINGRQFSTEKKTNNLFHNSDEDSLEVTVLRSDPVNKVQETAVQSEFFIKPVINGRHFLPDKTTNNFEDSFDATREAIRSQSVETKTIPKAPQYIIHPVDNGGNFPSEADKKYNPISDEDFLEISETFIRSKVPGTTKSTPANFVTSFQQGPSVVQSSRNFKKSYPQRAITKFGVTQEPHHFSGYPSPKICLEGEVIGLDGRCTFPEIIKNIFIYQKPLKEDVSGELINPPKPKIKINLVVIRSDGNDNRGDPIIIPPPQERTVVLVLDKEEENGGRKIIEVTPPPSGDPEVYFVDYKDGENPLLPGGIDLQEALGAVIQEAQQTYEVESQNQEKIYQSPQLQYGVPQQQYQVQQEQYQAPQLQYGPPQQHYQTLQKQFQAPQKEPEEQKPVVAQLFLEVDESSSSKEDFSFEAQPRILLPSPTRLLNLKQNTDNARRSRAIGRGLPSWGRLRATENKRMRPIPVARSNK